MISEEFACAYIDFIDSVTSTHSLHHFKTMNLCEIQHNIKSIFSFMKLMDNCTQLEKAVTT